MIDVGVVWAELESIIFAVWPDVADGYSATLARTVNWRDGLVSGELVPPFTILRALPVAPFDGLSIDVHHFTYDVEIYYVRPALQSADEVLEQTAPEREIEQRCIALGDALYTQQPHQSFFVESEWTVDVSDENVVNMFLAGVNPAIIAGCVKGQLIVSDYMAA